MCRHLSWQCRQRRLSPWLRRLHVLEALASSRPGTRPGPGWVGRGQLAVGVRLSGRGPVLLFELVEEERHLMSQLDLREERSNRPVGVHEERGALATGPAVAAPVWSVGLHAHAESPARGGPEAREEAVLRLARGGDWSVVISRRWPSLMTGVASSRRPLPASTRAKRRTSWIVDTSSPWLTSKGGGSA